MGRTLRELVSAQTMFSTYIQAADQLTAERDKQYANQGIISGMPSNQRQLDAVGQEISRFEEQLQHVLAKIGAATGKIGMEANLDCYSDCRHALDLAHKSHDNWRKYKALVDLNVALDNFAKATGPEETTKEQAEAALASLTSEYEATLRYVDQLLPTFPKNISIFSA